jgi:hypothetical protein
MVDYGLFFTDSLGARDGVRVAARQAVVENFSGDCSGAGQTSGDPALVNIACLALDQANAIGGQASARVVNAQSWSQGNPLKVCIAVTDEGVARYVPLPNDRTVRATITMRIELDKPPPLIPPEPAANSKGDATTGSALPPATTWAGWCT